MGKSLPPMELQRSFWNMWNASTREIMVGDSSLRQQEVLLCWIAAFGRRDLRILDAGCGAGWLCERLTQFGEVTGVDLADEVVARARQRAPQVTFISGDVMEIDLGQATFDVTISLEVLSHVADQPAFIARLADLTAPGGRLILSTQNRPILQRNLDIEPVKPGQLRRWVDSHELRRLLQPHFKIRTLRSLSPKGRGGFLRLANSPRLNAILRFATGNRADRMKERLGLGFSLIVLAEKRQDGSCKAPADLGRMNAHSADRSQWASDME